MKFHRTPVPRFFLIAVLVITLPVVVFFSQQRQETREHAAGINCNNTGVTKNPDGTYLFARLHVDSNGNIVDQNNCIIHLLGLNQGWLASGATGGDDAATIASWHQALPYNLVRINYNSNWWNNDVYVPKYNMNFRKLLQQFVTLAEQGGSYVELDAGPNFPELPCGGSVTLCTPQNQGTVDYNNDPLCKTNPTTCPEVKELTSYQPPAIQSLNDLTKLYANDPAVIFDVWNEPGGGPFDINLPGIQYFQAMQQRVILVNTNAPNSLVVAFSHRISEIINGSAPLYTGKNIVIDHHHYNPNVVPQDLIPYITFEHGHGWGTIINEYGGLGDTQQEQQTMTTLAKDYNAGLAYFEPPNLSSSKKPPVVLNNLGQLVQQSYTTVFGSLPPSPVFTQTPTPSQGVTLTPSATPTQSLSQTPSPTQTSGISFFLTLCPHGLGNCGDNANPSSGGNTSPLHTTRNITVSFTKANNNPVTGSPFQEQVSHVSSAQNFQKTLSIPNFSSGQYLVTVKMDGFLAKQIPGIISVTQGQQITLPEVFLVTGDIGPVPGTNNNPYGDNQLDITDYNVLISCFGSKMTTASCINPPTQLYPGADINDDGVVDGADYNLFLRELSVQHGG